MTIRKVELLNSVVTNDNAAGWEMGVYFGSGCGGSAFITGNTSGAGLTLGLSPGTYSVAETMQAGWTAVSSTCQTFTITLGAQTEVVFRNTRVP